MRFGKDRTVLRQAFGADCFFVIDLKYLYSDLHPQPDLSVYPEGGVVTIRSQTTAQESNLSNPCRLVFPAVHKQDANPRTVAFPPLPDVLPPDVAEFRIPSLKSISASQPFVAGNLQ